MTETVKLDTALEGLLAEVGLSVEDAGGRVSFAGSDPILPAKHRLGACIAVPLLANAVGAAAIWRTRTERGQDLHVDLRQAIHQVSPGSRFAPTLGGHAYPGGRQIEGNMFIFDPYWARDGRKVMATGVYPHMRDAWLRFLDCPPDRERVAKVIASWDAFELEDAAAAAGLVITVARTPAEWRAHPQGALLADSPTIGLEKLGDAPPRPFRRARRPLSDVRVLSFTHAIAGPTVGRSLAEQGADVLNATFPEDYEYDHIYLEANVGSRSTNLDLGVPEDLATVHRLLEEADVLVDNHRYGKLARFGLSPEQLAVEHPGLVTVAVTAFGEKGPWAHRGGFDFNGSATSGLMALEGSTDDPVLPLTRVINDHITGYLGALGALGALVKRASAGGSWHVSVNLASNAMWCSSLGLVDPGAAGVDEESTLIAPETITVDTPLGSLHRLGTQVRYSETPGGWESPVLVARGSSAPAWRESERA
jgi:crotonobetainyl-CoA:carnitine CoA-transferase CaiB-like acyl-CoA transferase